MTGQRKRDLDYQHMSELKTLEDNYNNELMRINEEFEKIFQNYSEQGKAAEENLNNRHRREMEELVDQLEQKLPKTIKFSKEYLDLKQSEANMVKQEK
jgi:hypothetical protein